MNITDLKAWVFVFIAVRLFIDGAEEYFILPTAWYYIRSLNETKIFLGLVTSAYSISAIIAGPIIGKLADKFGSIKSIVVLSYFMKFSGNFIYSIPTSAVFPLLGRLLAGIGDASSGVFYGQVARYTKRRNLAPIFLFLDGMYALGAAFGPTVSSFLTFHVDIYGWEINAGNSPGVILAVIWFTSLLISCFLPTEFGNSKIVEERAEVALSSDDQDGDYELGLETNEAPLTPEKIPLASLSTILCLYYLIFLSLYYSATVTFYTPLLALQHFHVQFIHVKLLFLSSSMFAFALILVLSLAAEYIEEKKLLVFLMLRQTIPIALLSYFSLTWDDVSPDYSYIMLVYICFGMPYFSFGIGSSLLCHITDPRDTAFYQGLCYSTLHLAYVLSRIISSFIFTKTTLLFYFLGLASSWIIGAVWFGVEYRNL